MSSRYRWACTVCAHSNAAGRLHFPIRIAAHRSYDKTAYQHLPPCTALAVGTLKSQIQKLPARPFLYAPHPDTPDRGAASGSSQSPVATSRRDLIYYCLLLFGCLFGAYALFIASGSSTHATIPTMPKPTFYPTTTISNPIPSLTATGSRTLTGKMINE